jgi:hypothetical protein
LSSYFEEMLLILGKLNKAELESVDFLSNAVYSADLRPVVSYAEPPEQALDLSSLK